MRWLYFTIFCSFLSGCAAGQMLPEAKRIYKSVQNTQLKKDTAYAKTLNSMAKNFGNSNSAIKSKDKDMGQIIAHGNYLCNVLRQTGDINQYSVEFTLDFKAKDQKVRFLFENINMIGDSGNDLGWGYLQITSEKNLKKVQSCLDEMVAKVTSSYSSDDSF